MIRKILLLALAGNLAGAEPNEKAKRYHDLLLKKPGNATLFGRFVESWLDTASKEELTIWLEASAKSGGANEWQMLASFRQYLGEDEAALQALNEAVSRDAENKELRLSRAKLQVRLLDFDAALKDLENPPDDPKLRIEVLKLKGSCLVRAGRVEEAVKIWKGVIEQFPDDEDLREDLIEMLAGEGLHEEAIASAQAWVAMTKDPYQKALRLLRLSDLQLLGGKRADGLKTHREILALTASGTWLEREALAQIERVFLGEDDVRGLRDFYQKLREEYPRRVSLHKALAHQMAANGEVNEAIALFRDVLKITPGDVRSREEFIAFLDLNERWKEAKEELLALIKRDEGNVLLWEQLVQLEEQLKNDEGLKAALTKLSELRKGEPAGVIAVADLYLRLHFSEEAETLLREGAKAFPESTELREALASTVVGLDQKNEALEIWRAMAKSADREGLLRVVRSLRGHGEFEEAFNLLESRMKGFENDTLVVSQFCQLALTEEQAIGALPNGLNLVKKSSSPTELENAIRLVSGLVKRAELKPEALKISKPASEAEVCLLAELHAQAGYIIRARDFLMNKDSILVELYRVGFEEKFGDLNTAIKLLTDFVARPEGRKTVYLRRLAGLLKRKNDFEGALAVVEEWKKMAPGNRQAWLERAGLLSALEREGEVVRERQRIIGKFGAQPDDQALLAEALMKKGDLQAARRIYQKLHDEGETSSVKLHWIKRLVELAEKDGRTNELLQGFQKRKRSNPKSIYPLLALAEIHGHLGDVEAKRQSLLAAMRRRPNDLTMLLRMAEMENLSGETERALALFREAVRRDRSDTSRRRLAKFLLDSGDLEEGLEILGRIPGELDDPRKIEATVLSLISRKDHELAGAYLLKGMGEHSADWRLSYLRAVLHSRKHEIKEADALFQILQTINGGSDALPGVGPPLVKPGQTVFDKVNVLGASLNPQSPNRQPYFHRRGTAYQAKKPLIFLPANLNELKLCALLQRIELINLMPEDRREAATDRILETLDPDTRLAVLSRLRHEVYRAELEKRFAENPDDADLASRWLSGLQKSGENTPQLLSQATATLAREKPYFLLYSTLGLSRKLYSWEEAFSLMKEIYFAAPEKDKATLLLRIFRSVSAQGLYDTYGPPLSYPGLHDFLYEEALLLKPAPESLEFVSQILSTILTSRGGAQAAPLVNQIMKWHSLGMSKQAGSSARAITTLSMRGWGGHVINTSIVAPSWPPKSIGGFWPTMLGYPMEVWNAPVRFDLEKARLIAELTGEPIVKAPVPLIEKWRGAVTEVTSPLLRAVIYDGLEEDDQCQAILTSLEETKDPEALLCLVGYWWENDEELKAYRYLLRLDSLSLDREMRRNVDAHLTYVGSRVASMPEIKDHDLEPARKAALRVSRIFSRTKIFLEALDDLGLERESASLSAKSSRKKQFRRASKKKLKRKRGTQLVSDLISRGRQDQALREAIKILRKKDPQSRGFSEGVIKLVKEHKLEIALLDRLKPDESASRSSRIFHAKTASRLNQPGIARPAYEALIKEEPDNFDFKVDYFLATPSEQRTLEIFESLEREEQLQDLVFNHIRVWNSQGDHRVSEFLTEAVIKILNERKPDKNAKSDLKWVNYYAVNFTHRPDFKGKRVGAVWGNDDFEPQDEDEEEVTALRKERSALVKKLLLAMLRHSQTTRQAFSLAVASKKSLKLTPEELIRYANLAFVAESEYAFVREKGGQRVQHAFGGYPSRNSFWTTMYRGVSRVNRKNPPQLISYDYLVKVAPEHDGRLFSEETLVWLKQNDVEAFEFHETVRKVAEGSAEAFSRWEKTLPEEKIQRGHLVLKFGKALLSYDPKPGLWTERFQDLFFEALFAGQKNHRYTLTTNWIEWRARHGLGLVPSTMEQLMTKGLGPREKWPLLTRIGKQSLPKEYREKRQFLDSLYENLATKESFHAPAMIFLSESKLQGLFSKAWKEGIQFWRGKEPFLKWLKQVKVMDVSEKLPSPGRVHLVSAGALALSRNNQGWIDDVKKSLAASSDFDPLLREIFIAQVDESVGLIPLMEEYHTVFLKMEQENPERIADLLKRWFPGFEAEGAGPKTHELLTRLKKFSHEAAWAKVEDLITREQLLGEVKNRNRGGYQHWQDLAALSSFDPVRSRKLAMKIAVRVRDEMRASPRLRQIHGREEDVLRKWIGNLFYTWRNKNPGQRVTEQILILRDFYESDLAAVIPWGHDPGGNLVSIVGSRAKKDYKKEIDIKGVDSTAAYRLMVPLLKGLPSRDQEAVASVVVPVFAGSWRGLDKESKKFLQQIDSEFRKEFPAIADLVMAYVYEHAARKHRNPKREEFKREQLAHITAYLQKSDLPHAFQLQLISSSHHAGCFQNFFSSPGNFSWMTKALSKVDLRGKKIPRYFMNILAEVSKMSEMERAEMSAFLDAVTGCLQTVTRHRGTENEINQLLHSTLVMAAREGRVDLVKKLVQQNPADFKGELPLMWELARHGITDVVLEFVLPMSEFYERPVARRYEKGDGEKIIALLATLSEEQRFRMEVQLASREDDQKENVPLKSRDERLVELASRFAAEASEDPTARLEILSLLVDERAAAQILGEEVRQLSEQFNFAKVIDMVEQSDSMEKGKRLMKVMDACWMNDLNEGSYEQVFKALESLALVGGNSHYHFKKACERLTDQACFKLIEEAVQSQEKARQSFPVAMDLFKGLFKLGKRSGPEPLSKSFCTVLILQSLAEEKDALNDFIAGLNQLQKNQFDQLKNRPLVYQLSSGISSKKSPVLKGIEARSKVVAAILTNSFFQKECFLKRHNLNGFVSGFVSFEELRKVIVDFPDEVVCLPGYLSCIIRINRTWEDDRIQIERGLKLAAARDQLVSLNRLRVLNAKQFLREKKIEKAQAALREVDVEKLGTNYQNYYETIKESLETHEAEKK